MAMARSASWTLTLMVALGGCRADTASPAAPTEAATDTPKAVEGPCPEGLPERARCGTVTVFEDRVRREGRTIDLAYVVLPPSSPEGAQPDPVFVLAGGPGQAATQLTPVIQHSLGEVARTRALVFVDQRGTGASNGLVCSPDDLSTMLEGPWGSSGSALIEGCAKSLPADLTHYATPTAMDDLDDVRVALGYETINLWGGSYGTRAGLAYLRQHGDHVRGAALWGVAPPGQPFPRTFGPTAQAVLERLMADCKADAGCNALLPDGVATVERITAKLQEAPAEVTVTDPRTQQPTKVTLNAEVFTGGLRLMLYDASLTAAVPAMLAAADHGDFGMLMQTVVPMTVAILTQIHVGMFLSVSCAEDVPMLTDDDRAATRETFIGDTWMAGLQKACEIWPRAPLPDGYLSAVRSDVPVLLMAGELDPVTPPPTAQLAAQTLSNSRVVPFANVGHGTSNVGACESTMLARFFDELDPQGLDARCAAEIARPPFVVPPSAQ